MKKKKTHKVNKLPPDPKDLKTNYKVSESDLTWTKNMIEENTVRFWVTSDAMYFINSIKKVIALLAYDDMFLNVDNAIENIARVKESTTKLGWEFGYDRILGETMKVNNYKNKVKYVNEKTKEVIGKYPLNLDGFDDFLFKTKILGHSGCDPKYF